MRVYQRCGDPTRNFSAHQRVLCVWLIHAVLVIWIADATMNASSSRQRHHLVHVDLERPRPALCEACYDIINNTFIYILFYNCILLWSCYTEGHDERLELQSMHTYFNFEAYWNIFPEMMRLLLTYSATSRTPKIMIVIHVVSPPM